jgi:hypothetical protein
MFDDEKNKNTQSNLIDEMKGTVEVKFLFLWVGKFMIQ